MSDTTRTSGFDWYGVSPNGVEVALHVDVEQAGQVDELVEAMLKADTRLAQTGFKRSERLSQSRGFGGGGGGGGRVQQRQEAAPPTDVIVPEHCGEPMVYRPERPAVGEKRAVSAHWDCRKGVNCEQAQTRGDRTFPFTNWKVEVKPLEPAGENEPLGDWNTFSNWSERQGFNWNSVVRRREEVRTAHGLPRPELWTQKQINRFMRTLEQEPHRYRGVAASLNGVH